jgi:hypothetical protein
MISVVWGSLGKQFAGFFQRRGCINIALPGGNGNHARMRQSSTKIACHFGSVHSNASSFGTFLQKGSVSVLLLDMCDQPQALCDGESTLRKVTDVLH